MKNVCLLLITLLLAKANLHAQPFAGWTKKELTLDNGFVRRRILLPEGEGPFVMTAYTPASGHFKFFTDRSPDFQFEADGTVYSGYENWQLVTVTRFTDSLGGDGASVVLISADRKIQLALQFLLYPGQPVIRKNLVIKNLTRDTVKLESIDVEKWSVIKYWPTTFSWICHDYGRRRSIGPYDGNAQDALVTVHNSDWQQGLVIGNEAAGVVKHTSAFWNEESICSGFTHRDARYPFRKYLAPADSFTTAQVFSIVYDNHKDPDEVLNTAVANYVRTSLGSRISQLSQKPTFVYNTWVPFGREINEGLIMELAKAAAAAGMKEFVIDDGWSDNYGDWIIDKHKFPHGLKPVFDYIKSLGMKPGLWVSVGSASPQSRVFREHPEWFVLDRAQHPTNLHTEDTTLRTACFGTGWYNYIREVLMRLAVDYGLEYMKLDFTVVTSPYRFTADETGCYAEHHAGHRDHNESFYTNYEQVWKLFDELHRAKPGLFIDCTFETMGGLQLVDYAMLKHAEGDWLSNFNGPEAKVDLRIRNMAWWRSPAMPATALVIGNPEMQDTAWELHLKSLAGALPIMLGDPGKLTEPARAGYRRYSEWLLEMERKYGIMNFRQDLSGFGEPMQGGWDGFQRINTDTRAGGILGIFRQGSTERARWITIQYLEPDRRYRVKTMNGSVMGEWTGRQLSTVGFSAALPKPYDGLLYEIERVETVHPK